MNEMEFRADGPGGPSMSGRSVSGDYIAQKRLQRAIEARLPESELKQAILFGELSQQNGWSLEEIEVCLFDLPLKLTDDNVAILEVALSQDLNEYIQTSLQILAELNDSQNEEHDPEGEPVRIKAKQIKDATDHEMHAFATRWAQIAEGGFK